VAAPSSPVQSTHPVWVCPTAAAYKTDLASGRLNMLPQAGCRPQTCGTTGTDCGTTGTDCGTTGRLNRKRRWRAFPVRTRLSETLQSLREKPVVCLVNTVAVSCRSWQRLGGQSTHLICPNTRFGCSSLSAWHPFAFWKVYYKPQTAAILLPAT